MIRVAWLTGTADCSRTVHSLAVYEVVSGMLRGLPPTPRQRRDAFDAPLDVWMRVLTFEGCAVQFERALQGAGWMREAPAGLQRVLRDATGASLRHSVIAHEQLARIGELTERNGIRIIVLKGAARLIAGALGGRRSIADIDLLVDPADAGRLHVLLQAEQGYAVTGPAQRHHLAPLGKSGCLMVEIHRRLANDELPLDRAIWQDTRRVTVGRVTLEIPSAANLLLHALEHATTLNWMSRYRLRDVVDVAECYTSEVSPAVVDAYVSRSGRRPALETLLSAAHDLEPRIPRRRARAWSTVRRVSMARLGVAVPIGDRLIAERLFRYMGVLAEASPATLVRATGRALRWVRAAPRPWRPAVGSGSGHPKLPT